MDETFSQEYTVNAVVPQGSIFGPRFSYYTLMAFYMVLRYIAIYADDTTLYSICSQTSNLP